MTKLNNQIHELLRSAKPAPASDRISVIEDTAKALGITSVLRAYTRDQYRTEDLAALTQDQLARTFGFLTVAAEMATEERAAG